MADEATPKVTPEQIERDWEYARKYYGDVGRLYGEKAGSGALEMLAKYRPEVFHGYMTLRQGAFNLGPDAALSRKMKELIIVAIEVATRKTNPVPLGHTRRAIDAGATVEEIAEVVSLCLLIAGMLSYHEAGWPVLQEAVNYAETKAKEGR
jgi:alkylhydroperoxidase/carboxymuconolactone decarboxylase family protein YurZ